MLYVDILGQMKSHEESKMIYINEYIFSICLFSLSCVLMNSLFPVKAITVVTAVQFVLKKGVSLVPSLSSGDLY